MRTEKQAEQKARIAAQEADAQRQAANAKALEVLALQAKGSASNSKDIVRLLGTVWGTCSHVCRLQIVTSFVLPAIGGGTDLLTESSLRFASGRRSIHYSLRFVISADCVWNQIWAVRSQRCRKVYAPEGHGLV